MTPSMVQCWARDAGNKISTQCDCYPQQTHLPQIGTRLHTGIEKLSFYSLSLKENKKLFPNFRKASRCHLQGNVRGLTSLIVWPRGATWEELQGDGWNLHALVSVKGRLPSVDLDVLLDLSPVVVYRIFLLYVSDVSPRTFPWRWQRDARWKYIYTCNSFKLSPFSPECMVWTCKERDHYIQYLLYLSSAESVQQWLLNWTLFLATASSGNRKPAFLRYRSANWKHNSISTLIIVYYLSKSSHTLST